MTLLQRGCAAANRAYQAGSAFFGTVRMRLIFRAVQNFCFLSCSKRVETQLQQVYELTNMRSIYQSVVYVDGHG